jgi:hypothetical protein
MKRMNKSLPVRLLLQALLAFTLLVPVAEAQDRASDAGPGVSLGYNIAQTTGFITWYGKLQDRLDVVDSPGPATISYTLSRRMQ